MTVSSERDTALPLAGLVVVEIGQNVAAPVAGHVLADLGAEVIKIEKLRGDDARRWGPPFWGDSAAAFKAINRNKRSVVVDFQSAQDVAALRALILDRADVVIQSMRPGLVQQKGLNAAELLAEKPTLVWCDLGAFGSGGPLSHQPGYDPLMQACGGLMSVTGHPNTAPIRTGYSVVDAGTGMWAVIAIQAALLKRQQTGLGGNVEVSLYETALAWMTVPAAQYAASGESPSKHGSGAEMIVPYRAYQTTDGYLVVAAGNDSLFAKLCNALGKPELPADPLFLDNPMRVKNRAALDQQIEAVMRLQSTQHWETALAAVGVPVAPVLSIGQALQHEQTHAIGMYQQVPGRDEHLVALPMRFDGARPRIRSAAPLLGADSALLDGYRQAG